MKEILKVNFTGFEDVGIKKEDNYFFNMLSERYDVRIDDDPELLFYSFFDNEHYRYSCHKVFFTGENLRPDFTKCDYAFTFDHIPNNPRHYRLPLYALYADPALLTRPKNIEQIIREKTQFCSFVVSNKFAKKRLEMFKKLSKYKKVNAGGKLFNNIGGRVKNKHEFLQAHKFDISFENSSSPGYTTEKIFEPMLLNTLPIYHGNPLVHLDFNPGSFINGNDFDSIDDLVDRIIEIDRNDELYSQILSEPWFHNNEVNEYVKKENILRQFEFIVNDMKTKEPVALRYPLKIRKIHELSRSMRNKILRAYREIKYILPVQQEFIHNQFS